ncbi:tetratricopeptide repeat protein [Streptomyces sp. CAU 1734]|uniref:tetratricopeptide repeat protein n=1 Tax=Streptomyces sp. CAU 1734 TaxID=3140360 RepID=UPI003260773A
MSTVPFPDPAADAGAPLSPDARELYRALGALPPELAVDADIAAAVCSGSWERAHTALGELADAGLTDPVPAASGPPRHRLTETAHIRARRALPQGADPHRTGAALRLCEWVLALATAACDGPDARRRGSLAPTPQGPVPDGIGQDWLLERPGLVTTALALAENARWDVLCWQLADVLYVHFASECPIGVEVWRDTAERGLAAARRAGHAGAERRMLRSLAVALAADGASRAAARQLADLDRLARADGDRGDEACAAYGLGQILTRQGEHLAARERFARAARLWGDTAPGTAPALNAAAEASLAAGDPAGALEAADAAHAAAQARGQDLETAWALALRGHARHVTADLPGGLDDLTHALSGFAHGDRDRDHARLLGWLADAHQDAHDTDRAAVYRGAARELQPGTHRPDLAETLTDLL